jgi:hypothetical protein
MPRADALSGANSLEGASRRKRGRSPLCASWSHAENRCLDDTPAPVAEKPAPKPKGLTDAEFARANQILFDLQQSRRTLKAQLADAGPHTRACAVPYTSKSTRSVTNCVDRSMWRVPRRSHRTAPRSSPLPTSSRSTRRRRCARGARCTSGSWRPHIRDQKSTSGAPSSCPVLHIGRKGRQAANTPSLIRREGAAVRSARHSTSRSPAEFSRRVSTGEGQYETRNALVRPSVEVGANASLEEVQRLLANGELPATEEDAD